MKHRIVCIEDDPFIQELYLDILTRRGYDAVAFGSGEEVLQDAATEPASLYIIDLRLPDIDGLELVDRLRDSFDADVPFIIVSATEQEGVITASLEKGALDYLVKPVRPAILLAKIGSILNRPALRKLSRSHLKDPLFAGKYELLSKLGSGTSSTVYLARAANQPNANRLALKIFELGFMSIYDHEDIMARFLREAYQMAKLRHPKAVRLVDFGKADSGHFYLAQEFVEGETLQDVLISYDQLAEQHVASIGYEMTDLLHYLESQHLVHRDINPRNIMITHQGTIKVIDFGLARTTRDRLSADSDMLLGTPLFLAPELLASPDAESSILCDIYSLGVTMYVCLCRHTPFGGSAKEVVNQRRERSLPPLKTTMPQLKPDLTELIDEMIAEEPENRPDVETLRERLGHFLATDPDYR